MNIYEHCPTLESGRILLRLVQADDCEDLLAVYSDKNALPFFNSDNCGGDNFYYPTQQRMQEALAFWQTAYENGWFVRLAIADKAANCVIGTIELCLRVSEDDFDHMGILRVDVCSGCEQEDVLTEIFALIAPQMKAMLGCKGVITKTPIYAVERIRAIERVGFVKSDKHLIGSDGYAYDGYWTLSE